jgi:hypothetical protein
MKRTVLNRLVVLAILFLQLSVQASDYRKIQISEDIELIQLSEKAYVHVSVTEMAGFGNVSC